MIFFNDFGVPQGSLLIHFNVSASIKVSLKICFKCPKLKVGTLSLVN